MFLQGATVVSLLLGILACASQRPVLSSNEHLMRVGGEVGKRDIDECMARAEATSTESGNATTGNVVAGTATSSVVGAAAGGAGGAIFGQAGQGAAAGAVGILAGRQMQMTPPFALTRLGSSSFWYSHGCFSFKDPRDTLRSTNSAPLTVPGQKLCNRFQDWQN